MAASIAVAVTGANGAVTVGIVLAAVLITVMAAVIIRAENETEGDTGTPPPFHGRPGVLPPPAVDLVQHDPDGTSWTLTLRFAGRDTIGLIWDQECDTDPVLVVWPNGVESDERFMHHLPDIIPDWPAVADAHTNGRTLTP